MRTELNSEDDHVLCFGEIRSEIWSILSKLHSLMWCTTPLPQHFCAPKQSLRTPFHGLCVRKGLNEKCNCSSQHR